MHVCMYTYLNTYIFTYIYTYTFTYICHIYIYISIIYIYISSKVFGFFTSFHVSQAAWSKGLDEAESFLSDEGATSRGGKVK